MTAEPAARSWRSFAHIFVAASLVALAACLTVTVGVDPYWVFRDTPPWLGWTGGVNRHLDVEMRRAKPLQLFARPAGTVLIGSSVAYRGLRPADLRGPGYNLGLSSLMADELPGLARLVAQRRGVGRVLIGLDYFTFTAMPGPPRLDPRLADAGGRAGAWVGAALSWRALAGSHPAEIRAAPERGEWLADGFKTTPDYPPATTRRMAAEQDFAAMAYRPETLPHLAAALAALRGQDVQVYLSPTTAAWRDAAAAAGRRAEIGRWRADVRIVAERAGVRLHDLSDAHPFEDFSPAAGSSGFWLDSLHFKPEVGRWVLGRMLGSAGGSP